MHTAPSPRFAYFGAILATLTSVCLPISTAVAQNNSADYYPIQAETAAVELPKIPANDINAFAGYFCANVQLQIPNFALLTQILASIEKTIAQIQGLTQILQVLEDPSVSVTVNANVGNIASCLPGLTIPTINFNLPDLQSCFPDLSAALSGIGACIQSKIPKIPKIEIPNVDPQKIQECLKNQLANISAGVNVNLNLPGIDLTNPLSIISGLLTTIQGILNLLQNLKVVLPDFSKIQFSLDFLKNYCAFFKPGGLQSNGGIPVFTRVTKGADKGKYLMKIDSNTIGICTKKTDGSFSCKRPTAKKAGKA